MRIHVTFRPRRQGDAVVEVADGARAQDVLSATGQSPDSTVVVRNGTPISESAVLVDGDRLMLLSSFSGG